MAKTDRFLFIYNRLKDSGSFTIKDVVDKFEVSKRTVKRDIEDIRARLGIDIPFSGAFPPRYVISIDDQRYLNMIFEGEGILLLSLLKSISGNRFLFPMDFRQIRNNLNLPDGDSFNDLTDRICYEMSEEKALDYNLFVDITDSIKGQTQLQISYVDLSGNRSSRIIEPQYLRNSDGQWHLVAWCHSRRELRIFHVSRIVEWERIESGYEKKFSIGDIQNFLGSGFGIMQGDDVKIVSILFSGKAVRLIQGKRWHKDQVIEPVEDGVVISFPVLSFEEILRVVLSYHTEAEVLGPPEFRDIWIKKIREMGEKFQVGHYVSLGKD